MVPSKLKGQRRALAARLALLLPALACGGPWPTEQGVAPIFHGELDSTAAVVEVLIDGAAACTGTVIGPRSVLSAAHCFVQWTRAEIRVGSSTATIGGQRMAVSAVSVSPAFQRHEDGTLSGDIAVLSTAEEIETAAVPLGTNKETLVAGTTLRVVGFGGDELGGRGERRSGMVELSEVGDTTLKVRPAPGLPCGGDSGGPNLLRVAGREVLVGVTSYADAPCEEYGVSSRVDAYSSFISAAIAQPPPRLPDGSPCTADGECATLSCVADAPEGGQRHCRTSCQLELGCVTGECRFTGRNAAPYACLPTEAKGPSGCAAMPWASSLACWLAGLAALNLLQRRPIRR